MANILLLDSGPLGRIAHPRPNRELALWLDGMLAAEAVVILAEMVDYELRRSFLLESLVASVQRLDRLKLSLTYLPLTTVTLERAATLWPRRGDVVGRPRTRRNWTAT